MFEHKELQKLSGYFLEPGSRKGQEVYFYRITMYSQEIHEFILKYYEAARASGAVIEGRIPNPDEKNLDYYGEIMGMDFKMDPGFLSASLKKWLPRMREYQREQVSLAIYGTLDAMRREGKNENMQKNAYIKFMCWLYYKFERIVNLLGEETIPKILYEGNISNYELMLISILSNAGCDVVLLQYQGEASYQKLDSGSVLSDELKQAGQQPFPEGFCIKQIRQQVQEEMNKERLYGRMPKKLNCTNAWIQSDSGGLALIKKNAASRGSDPGFFYNCYIRINGAEDKLTYANELYQFQLELKNSGRRRLIVNECIERPAMDEIAAVHRSNYAKQDQMILDLSSNIKYTANLELQRMMVKSFVDVMYLEAEKTHDSLNKLTNKAVYLLCWLGRYQEKLFSGWKEDEIGCFIYMGGCGDENEAVFVRFLARLPDRKSVV